MRQPRVAVLVPLSEQLDAWRQQAWWLVRRRLGAIGWPVLVGLADADAWSKGLAVAHAREQAGGADVVIVHDSDVVVNVEALRAAVRAVAGGDAEWAVPHETVYRLDKATTSLFTARGELPHVRRLARPAYRGVRGGGCTVMPTEVYDETPLDPRFVGWGGEDEAWGWALHGLHGAPWRGDAPLFHLWHPHAAPGAQRPPAVESAELRRQYRNARHVPRLLRAVVQDSTPAAKVRLLEAVAFERTGGLRSFGVLGQLVRFPADGGPWWTSDPDVVEVLDRTPGVRRANRG